MRKITMNLLAAGVLVTGLLAGCSSETTTGVDANGTNTESNQTEMDEGNMTDTTTTGTDMDTTNQNPPTDETGNQDQN